MSVAACARAGSRTGSIAALVSWLAAALHRRAVRTRSRRHHSPQRQDRHYDAAPARGARGARRPDRGDRRHRPTSARWPGRGTRVIDLAGRTVIPGLIDSHIHAIRAGLTYTTEVHWIGARSLAEALDRLRAAAGPRRRGAGWWSPAAGSRGSSPKAAARPRPRSRPPRPTITSMCRCCTPRSC